jgi:hypothetical protein
MLAFERRGATAELGVHLAEAVEQARRQATADISTTDILAAIDEGRTGR